MYVAGIQRRYLRIKRKTLITTKYRSDQFLIERNKKKVIKYQSTKYY